MMMTKNNKFSIAAVIMAALALVVALYAALFFTGVPEEEPVARGYATLCRFESGGSKIVCASGGEIEVQSGGTLDVQSGASITLSGYVTSSVDSLIVNGTAIISDAATLSSTLTTAGAATVGSLTTAGAATMGSLTTAGAGSVGSLTVNGATVLSDAVTLSSTLTLEEVAFSGPVRFGSATVVTGTSIAHGLGVTPTAVVISPLYDGALTQTFYVMSADNISITIGLETGSITTTTVYWMAGR
jgi:hypothetical protein